MFWPAKRRLRFPDRHAPQRPGGAHPTRTRTSPSQDTHVAPGRVSALVARRTPGGPVRERVLPGIRPCSFPFGRRDCGPGSDVRSPPEPRGRAGTFEGSPGSRGGRGGDGPPLPPGPGPGESWSSPRTVGRPVLRPLGPGRPRGSRPKEKGSQKSLLFGVLSTDGPEPGDRCEPARDPWGGRSEVSTLANRVRGVPPTPSKS